MTLRDFWDGVTTGWITRQRWPRVPPKKSAVFEYQRNLISVIGVSWQERRWRIQFGCFSGSVLRIINTRRAHDHVMIMHGGGAARLLADSLWLRKLSGKQSGQWVLAPAPLQDQLVSGPNWSPPPCFHLLYGAVQIKPLFASFVCKLVVS